MVILPPSGDSTWDNLSLLLQTLADPEKTKAALDELKKQQQEAAKTSQEADQKAAHLAAKAEEVQNAEDALNAKVKTTLAAAQEAAAKAEASAKAREQERENLRAAQADADRLRKEYETAVRDWKTREAAGEQDFVKRSVALEAREAKLAAEQARTVEIQETFEKKLASLRALAAAS